MQNVNIFVFCPNNGEVKRKSIGSDAFTVLRTSWYDHCCCGFDSVHAKALQYESVSVCSVLQITHSYF